MRVRWPQTTQYSHSVLRLNFSVLKSMGFSSFLLRPWLEILAHLLKCAKSRTVKRQFSTRGDGGTFLVPRSCPRNPKAPYIHNVCRLSTRCVTNTQMLNPRIALQPCPHPYSTDRSIPSASSPNDDIQRSLRPPLAGGIAGRDDVREPR